MQTRQARAKQAAYNTIADQPDQGRKPAQFVSASVFRLDSEAGSVIFYIVAGRTATAEDS